MKESNTMYSGDETYGDEITSPTHRPAAAQPKQIIHQNKEYDMYLGGRYVGTRPTRKAAEEALDALAYEAARRS